MIEVREVGLREGVQISKKKISTAWKLKILERMQKLGFSSIEATSIVRKDLVPNHSDFDIILNKISNFENPKKFSALYLNKKGFEILQKSKLDVYPLLYTAADEEFLIKNVSRDYNKELSYFSEMQDIFLSSGFREVRILISTAFGLKSKLSYESFKKRLDQIISHIKLGISEICLADTSGIATPDQIRLFVRGLSMEFKNLALHLHDTQGLGLINAFQGLESGVKIFETSLAGLGGCPFLKNASGNLATEEFVLMLNSLGVECGLKIELLKPLVIDIAKKFTNECHSKLAKKWIQESLA